jgi:hypothetical protein
VIRTVVRRLVAFEATHSTAIPIEPGTNVETCHILRNPAPADAVDWDVYSMEFEVAGRRLRCPLVDFQARTQSIQTAGAEEIPARETAISS